MMERRSRHRSAATSVVLQSLTVSSWCLLLSGSSVGALSTSATVGKQLANAAFLVPQQNRISFLQRPSRDGSSRLFLQAPPGSGYLSADDEVSELPESYEPMMEYPGTMRPGRTPENMPFHDLPIADTDPDPVPWPHFQQIEWHHKWEPPHPHPIPMEEFIEQQGRWATPEMEAQMRAGIRKSARQRTEMEESQKRMTTIVDDDDDDEPDGLTDLGDGIFGELGSSTDQAVTAAAVTPGAKPAEEEKTDEIDTEDPGLDDFLLDLGLDIDDDGEEDTEETPDTAAPIESIVPTIRTALEDVTVDDDDGSDESTPEDASSSETGVTASIAVDDDDDLELGLEDEDDLDDAVSTVPLEDFSDGNDSFESDEFFNDGGFDYDEGDSNDASDSW